MNLLKTRLKCQRPVLKVLNTSFRFNNNDSKRRVSFSGPIRQHLIDIKIRHQQMSDQLMNADKLEVSEITRISKDCAELSRVVELSDERNVLLQSIVDLENMIKDESNKGTEGDEMTLLANEEIDESRMAQLSIEADIIKALTPRDEADDKGVVLEVRAGTGTCYV
jgi:peptide chain release factor 1